MRTRREYERTQGQRLPGAGPAEPSRRDEIAERAPIPAEWAFRLLGDFDFRMGEQRAAAFALWAMLRYEYADAMLERANEPRSDRKPADHAQGEDS